MPVPNTYALVDQAKNNLKKLETYITTGMEDTAGLSLDIVEHSKATCGEHVESLKQIMLEYVKMEQELHQFLQITETITHKCRQGECDGVDLEKMLDEKLSELPTNTDYNKHDSYIDMVRRVDELMNVDEEDEDEDGEREPTQIDEDMAMTQEIITKCPYTGKDMVIPVQNKHCKHNYDKEGITEAMKLRKGKTKCPVPGCINEKPIQPEDLEENRKLKRYIEKLHRGDKKRGRKD